jgi:hypothetical protein
MRTYPNPFGRLKLRRGAAFGAIIIFALLSFEIFNYSTTDFALHDLLGDLNFLGLRWSTILALAFCGIDFAGIARIFTPEQGADEPTEIWYLFGAWLLAATMNAALTWWGVSIAILQHETLGNAVVERATLLKVVPIFVALLVWLSRVLLIGTFSVAGERLFSEKRLGSAVSRGVPQNPQRATQWTQHPGQQSPFRRPAPKPQPQRSYAPQDPAYEAHFDSRPEPTYHPVSLQGRSTNQNYRS